MSFSELGYFEKQYVKHVSDLLDTFQVEEEADFEPIQAALKAIAEPNSNVVVADNLKERVSLIRERINETNGYSSRILDMAPVKECLLSKVAEKIEYFESLNPEQKQQFVQKVKEHKAKMQQYDLQIKHRTRNPIEIEYRERSEALSARMSKLEAEGNEDSPEWTEVREEIQALGKLREQADLERQEKFDEAVDSIKTFFSGIVSRLFGR